MNDYVAQRANDTWNDVQGMMLMSGAQFLEEAPSEISNSSISPLLTQDVFTASTIIIMIFKSLLTIGCIGGNSLVIFSVITVHKLRTPPNFLIVSLAVSDLLVGITVMPLSIMYDCLGTWILGATFCSTWVTFDVMLCTASILNLMILSVDRYLLITSQSMYHQARTKSLMLLYISIAWTVSTLISVTPIMIGWGADYTGELCIINQKVGYQLYATLGAFYVPLGVMLALYSKLFCITREIIKSELKNLPSVPLSRTEEFELSVPQTNNGKQSTSASAASDTEREDGACLQTENNNVKDVLNHNNDAKTSNKKVESNKHRVSKRFKIFPTSQSSKRRTSLSSTAATRTLGVVMGTFTICWLPFFILALVSSICGDNCEIPQTLTIILNWLGYFNSCLNPVIYAHFNSEFREPFKEILCCRCRTIKQHLRQLDYANRFT